MLIRQAKIHDIDNLVKLDTDANLTCWAKAEYLSSLQNKQHFIYLLEEHGKIQGCIVIGMILDEAEILQFWVSRASHRKGYGRYLLSSILNDLKQRLNIIGVFLEVRDGNTAAINLYSSIGFVQVGRRINYYNVGTWQFDAIVMQKKF